MLKTYQKPNLIIKNYYFKTQIMESNVYNVYDAGAANDIQYTLGTLNQ